MEWIYITAACLFIIGLKMLSSPATARQGNFISAAGMLLAIVATLARSGIISYGWIAAGLIVGSLIGAVAAARVKMTAMPEMVALFNGFGGLSSLLVGWAEYHMHPHSDAFTAASIYFAVLIGGITFTGSVLAYLKLAARISGQPITFSAQQIVNGALLALAVVLGVLFTLHPETSHSVFLAAVVLSLILGVLAVLPIGGADMPVVISLLNSYSGIAAAAAGFVISNTVLIVAGSLVGASGIILTRIMCKAMNRSITNVLFGAFGQTSSGVATDAGGTMREISLEDAAVQLAYARQVIFVPGYGMATAQAQHAVRELGEALAARGVIVKFAIHPVAGRMPGHMNVLLAEANVPYSDLYELEAINPEFPNTDVAVVIGANDVVNPDARDNPGSPIAGMPILEVDRAKSVIVLKRGAGRGFSGLENPLFFKPVTGMLYGDAKESLNRLVIAIKEA
jgi:NAD(P) transhydrogenase subunit beta